MTMTMNPDKFALICSNDDYVFLFTREYLLQPFCYHFVCNLIDRTYLYGFYTLKVDFSATHIQRAVAVYSGYQKQPFFSLNCPPHAIEDIYNSKHDIDSIDSFRYYDFDMDLSDTIYGDFDRALCDSQYVKFDINHVCDSNNTESIEHGSC
jgi:hypothetical protein